MRTPYVVFLDADDLLLEGALARARRGTRDGSRRSAHTLSIVDGDNRPALPLAATPRVRAVALAGPVRAGNTIWSLLPTQGCTIMRVGDVRGCGGYADCSQGEDWVLGVSLAFRGSVSFGRRPGLMYRLRENSPGAGALSSRTLLENARAVRVRVREDPAIPAWVRSALPLIAAAQWCAVCIAHPLYRLIRTIIDR